MSICVSVSSLAPPGALAQPSTANAPKGEGEGESDSITVVGERLRQAGGAIGINPITGKMKCKVTHPSGNDRIDAAACEIALRCARQDRHDRDRFNSCVETGYKAFLDTYFAAAATKHTQ